MNSDNTSEIILPNGKQTKEVIGPDGSTIWQKEADIPDSVVDDFERGDLSPYSTSPSSVDWDVSQSDVVEGDWAASVGSTGFDDQQIVSEPGDGLDYYPEMGDTIAFLIREVATSDDRIVPGLAFCGSISGGEYSGYGAEIDGRDDHIALYKWDESEDSENRTELALTNQTIDAPVWYWGEVDIPESDGEIEFRLYELNESEMEAENYSEARGTHLATVSATDSDYVNQQGIGGVKRSDGDGATCLDWIVKIDPDSL